MLRPEPTNIIQICTTFSIWQKWLLLFMATTLGQVSWVLINDVPVVDKIVLVRLMFWLKNLKWQIFAQTFWIRSKIRKFSFNKLSTLKKCSDSFAPYRLLKFVYSSIDLFSYFELATSKILLKSILKRKRNPLITKNRFGTFQLSLGYLNNKKPQ